MRRLLILFGVVALCSAPTWADSIELEVNAWATFTAPASSCLSNCTETIGVSFLYDTPSLLYESGQIVPGTLDISSSGFLGSFSTYCPTCSSFYGYYMGFFNSLGDEIDLDWNYSSTGIQPGINTVDFYLWSCQSQSCDDAYGETWIGLNSAGEPSKDASIVTRAVPDETSFLSLSLTALGAVGLAWRWRRREAREAETKAVTVPSMHS